MKSATTLLLLSILFQPSWTLADTSDATDTKGGRSVNLKEVMQAGAENMLNCCNPQRNYLPYFRIGSPFGECDDHAWNHNIGRWLDSLLRVEEAIGFKIPPDRERVMLENLKKFCENPDNLPFGPRDKWMEIEPDFYLHSLREYILAVNALARYRKSEWATEHGHKMLETIWRASKPDGNWNLDEFDTYVNFVAKYKTEKDKNQGFCPHSTSDRVIEALIGFHETTGDPLARKLADRFASFHLANSTNPDGSLNVASLQGQPTGHTHSYLGGLRGLLLYGEMTKQQKYIDAVLATYLVTVRRIVRESGYACHDLEQIPGKVTNVPEAASAGDAAQLAMWLAFRHGHEEFLDDAERWVRCRIVPGQIPEKYAKDGNGQVDRRFLGGWGAYHQPQGGMMCYPDVTAAVLHTLCDVYRHIAVRSGTDLKVNFHFDYEDDNVRITSRRAEEAEVSISPKNQDDVFIRIPGWTPPESVRITVDGKPLPVKMVGRFAQVRRESLSPSSKILLRYALPLRTTTETINDAKCEYTWRGDDIVGVSPNTDNRPFYPTAERK
jgi:hypothetical protein